MQNDSTKQEFPEVTWTPATCEGLPPVGTRIAYVATFYGKTEWHYGEIRSYFPSGSPKRPVDMHGDEPYVNLLVEVGPSGWDTNARLADLVLLGIEKQPKGWPGRGLAPNKPDLNAIRRACNMTEDAFADLLKHWLKDNGYLKR